MQLSYPNRAPPPNIPYLILDIPRFSIRKTLKRVELILNKNYSMLLYMIPDKIVIVNLNLEFGRKDWNGVYDIKKAIIYVNNTSKFKYVTKTILHELGHHIYYTNRKIRLEWNKYYNENLVRLNPKFVYKLVFNKSLKLKYKQVKNGILGTLNEKCKKDKRNIDEIKKIKLKLKHLKVFNKLESYGCYSKEETFAEVFAKYFLDTLVHKSNKLKMQELLKVYENDQTVVH